MDTTGTEDDESHSHPSKNRPALTSITNTNHNHYGYVDAEADAELKNASLSLVVPVYSREFHPGRYNKLRKLAVLATMVKPPHESLYFDHTGIQTVEDWNELVELHAIKLQQQQDAKARKEQLKLLQQPAKKKLKSLPKAALTPNPRTIIPGIQLRNHLHHQDKVAFEDDGIDCSAPVQVVRHQKFLLQFLHYMLEKVKPPTQRRSYHPLLKRLFPPSSSSARKIFEAQRGIDMNRCKTLTRNEHDPVPDVEAVLKTNVSDPSMTIDCHNVINHDHFASRISIHNPVAVSHLVVLEIHVRTLNDAESVIQSITKAPLPKPRGLPPTHCTPPTVNGTNHHNLNVVVLPTTWYDTNATEPQSITDRLMYYSEWKQKRNQRGAFEIGFIYDQLKPFVLSYDQWETEKYPQYVPPAQPRKIPNESPLSAVVNDKVRDDWQKSRDENRFLRGIKSKDYAMMELKEARQFIKPYEIQTGSTADATVTAADIDDNTNNALVLLPFVRHHHPGLMMDKRLESTIPPEPHERDFFVEHDDFDDSPQDTRRIFAMDCEMVETEIGKELARVTICEMVFFDQIAKLESVDAYKYVHLDSVFVQPYNRITDYFTEYSGISADVYLDADNETGSGQNRVLRLEQVQAALLQLIHPCDIVIGHSLENQLHALRFIHPTVVDTALIFSDNHEGKDTSGNSLPFKHSLRHLAAVLLKREIQLPDRTHCCTEDAFTVMDLAVLRAIYGPSFCINNTKGNSSNWFTKLPHQIKNPITAVAVGPSQWLRQHVLSPSSSSNAIQALQCESVDDRNSQAIAGWVTGPTRRSSVVWSKMELSESSNSELIRMKAFVHDVITKLSSNNSVLLMIPIQIDYSGMKELHQQRQLHRDDPSTAMPWSEADEEQYQKSLEECSNGYILYITAKG